MPAPAPSPSASPARRAGRPDGLVGRAFGIDIHAPFTIDGVSPARAGAAPRTLLRLVSDHDLERGWRSADAVPVRRIDLAGGELGLLIERHEELGYLVESPGYGRHHVAPDGSLVRCAPPAGDDGRWHSLLVGQVLPLAAALRGFEVLHAGAVAVDGRVLAISGPSGAGKSTVTSALLLEGATFFTDDVLALEGEGVGVMAHPGPAVTKLVPDSDTTLLDVMRAGIAEVVGTHGKTQLVVTREPSALPLGAVYFLERAEPGSPSVIEPATASAAQLMLGSAYSTAVRTPERLLRQLDVCARVARSARVFTVKCAQGGARGVARLIAEHGRTAPGAG